MKDKVHERKEIQDTLERREKEEEHLQKERERRLADMRRRETKLDRDIAIRERQEQRFITRLRKLKSELTRYGGADLVHDAGLDTEEGAVTEEMLEKERKATEALQKEVEQMERDRERPVHPPHSGKSSIPRVHAPGAQHGNVVRYLSPTPIAVSGGTILPAEAAPMEAALLRSPAPGVAYPPAVLVPGRRPGDAGGVPPPTSFMPPAAAMASPPVLYRAPVRAGVSAMPTPVPPGMFRSVSSTVLGF
jgi:hypothetical protein